MTACQTCGADPCANPSFCRSCEVADRRKVRGERPRFIDASLWRNPPEHIPTNWNEISLEALMAHFDGARRRQGAAQATIEALMFSLRERGTKALEESATKRRLFELSEQQVIEVGNRVQRLRPEIARAWTAAEVEILLEARVKNA
jgi:hypothetical protein